MELTREGKELLEKIFEILTAAIMEITVFCHKKSCIMVKINQHGRGTIIHVFTLKTEEKGAAETSVNAYQNTRRDIPEDILHVAKVKLLFLASHEIFATLTNVSGKRFTSQFGLCLRRTKNSFTTTIL
jgi:hypothetical protein